MNVRKTNNHQGKDNHYSQLVLLISAKEAKLFEHNGDQLEPIKLSKPDTIFAYERDLPNKVGNFTNAQAQKEILINKFLLNIDQALGDALRTHRYPLFVLGTKKTTGQFNKLSKHAKKVTKYIHGNFNEKTTFELKQLLAPHILALDYVKE